MTRKGRLPVVMPKGVDVKFVDQTVTVKGPLGELELILRKEIEVDVEGGQLLVKATANEEENKKFIGLYRTLIDNMVQGVVKPFEKKLEMHGVGYRANVQGKTLNLQVGFSHPTNLEIPAGINVVVEKNTLITISGSDKQRVGQYAALIRKKRPPEPYQGKGIRYQGEYLRRKAGKTSKK